MVNSPTSKLRTLQRTEITRRIEKVTDQLRMLKNSNRGLLKNQRPVFMNMMKAHLNNASRQIGKHEKAFKAKPWYYSKALCEGKSHCASLSCSSEVAFLHFSDITKASRYCNGFPSWIKKVMPIPERVPCLSLICHLSLLLRSAVP